MAPLQPARCPFCEPHPDEVLVENDQARVLVDIRPLCEGHVLVVPKTHAESVEGAAPEARAAVRSLARRIGEVLRGAYREAGIYEHGGSPICRPRACLAGPTHAHLHVLPVSEDLITAWAIESDRLAHLGVDLGDTHYLYQELGASTEASREPLPDVVPRHFVRRLLQQALADRSRRWLPLGADPRLHSRAVDDTRRLMTSALSLDWQPPLQSRALGLEGTMR